MKSFVRMFGIVAIGGLCSAVALAASALEEAEAKQEGLAVGGAGPAWKDLVGVDDKTHSLSDLKDAKAVVVVFICNHCPVAQAYEDRIVELAADYKDKGVEVVAINVNNIEADKLPAMKERAEEKGFSFQYLYDPSQAIGRAYGAKVTPHAFVLDSNRKLAYVGAIDDNMAAEKVEKKYLRDAIDSVLAGTAPGEAETKPMGCAIRYE